MQFVLGIDQGTTGTTAIIIDQNLKMVAKHNVPFRQIFPKPGWVEHSGEDIFSSVKQAVTECLRASSLDAKQISAIGITNQRETTGIFDDQGNLLHDFIVWQCKRSTEICDEFQKKGLEKKIRQKTGLLLDPYFSATKLTWLFRQYPNFKKNRFGTVDSWLLYKLSAGKIHATDATNASRTMLMDLESCQWDQELCEIFEVPMSCLPEIKNSSEVYGTTQGLDFLPDGIPIASLIGDQQAALFGQACFEPGEAKATYGTGCFILLNTGKEIVRSQKGILSSVALKTQTKITYCLEASAFIAGAAIQWLKEGLGLIQDASEIEVLAKQVKNSGDVVFVPALSGLGAPYWLPETRGAFFGLSRDSTKAHLARAVLEGIALLNQDMLHAMKEGAGRLASLRVDGGAAQNDFLIQLQADLTQIPCLRSQHPESTALGAAFLAGLGVGIFENFSLLKEQTQKAQIFKPDMTDAQRTQLQSKWQQAMIQLTGGSRTPR